jgi:hypothetical protein
MKQWNFRADDFLEFVAADIAKADSHIGPDKKNSEQSLNQPPGLATNISNVVQTGDIFARFDCTGSIQFEWIHLVSCLSLVEEESCFRVLFHSPAFLCLWIVMSGNNK